MYQQSTCNTSRVATLALGAVLLVGVAACGSDESRNAAGTTTAEGGSDVPGSSAQVERRVGGVAVRAYSIQTSTMAESVAREHGIERSPDLLMVRASGRAGESGIESVPLQVEASVTDLQGRTEALAMREVAVNGLTDYVATVRRTPPDTLRFDIAVTTPDGSRESMQLTRALR